MSMAFTEAADSGATPDPDAAIEASQAAEAECLPAASNLAMGGASAEATTALRNTYSQQSLRDTSMGPTASGTSATAYVPASGEPSSTPPLACAAATGGHLVAAIATPASSASQVMNALGRPPAPLLRSSSSRLVKNTVLGASSAATNPLLSSRAGSMRSPSQERSAFMASRGTTAVALASPSGRFGADADDVTGLHHSKCSRGMVDGPSHSAVTAIRLPLHTGISMSASETQALQQSLAELIREAANRDAEHAAAEARAAAGPNSARFSGTLSIGTSSGGPGTGAAGGQGGPSYQRSTVVLPKAPLQEYPGASEEMVKNAFSSGSYLGIRSLPDALRPDFRARLYDEMIETGRSESGAHSRGGLVEPTVFKAGHLGLPHTAGLKHVHKAHPLAGSFATYEYMSTEYGRENVIARFEGLRSKVAQVSHQDFIVKAPPSVARGLPTFNEFTATSNLYGARPLDPGPLSSRAMGPGFIAGGAVDAHEAMRGRCDEAMAALCDHLSNDWPTSFLQIFEDRSGAVVISFQRDRAIVEGDLSSYMNQLSKTNPIIGDFALRKDGAQWGIIDADSSCVFFLLWPPWIHHRQASLIPAQAQAPSSTTTACTATAEQPSTSASSMMDPQALSRNPSPSPPYSAMGATAVRLLAKGQSLDGEGSFTESMLRHQLKNAGVGTSLHGGGVSAGDTGERLTGVTYLKQQPLAA